MQRLEKGGNVTRETLEQALGAVGLKLTAVSLEEDRPTAAIAAPGR